MSGKNGKVVDVILKGLYAFVLNFGKVSKETAFLGSLALAVLLAFNVWLLFFYRLPGNNAYWAALQNSGHAFIFLLFSISLAVTLDYFFGRKHFSHRLLVTFILCLIFGGGVEILQSYYDRQASWSDFWLDIAGTVSGLFFYAAFLKQGRFRWFFSGIAIIPLVISVVEPVKWKYAEIRREQRFPVLADFEDNWLNFYIEGRYSSELLMVNAPDAWRGKIGKVAQLNFLPGSWPGLYMFEVERDWRGHSELSFEVYNPSEEPVTLVVRVHDSRHTHLHKDRFNRTFVVPFGSSLIKIKLSDIEQAPKGRSMDLARIDQVFFYMARPKYHYTLYFDNIQLN